MLVSLAHLAVAVIIVDHGEGHGVAAVEALEGLAGVVHGGKLGPHTPGPRRLAQRRAAQQGQHPQHSVHGVIVELSEVGETNLKLLLFLNNTVLAKTCILL